MKKLLGVTCVALALLGSNGPGTKAQTGLELTIDGNVFKVNGNQTLLVTVSYFDAIHADLGDIDDDFAWLAGNGVNGVRIFANWFRFDGPGDGGDLYLAQDTLFNKDGDLRSGTLSKLLDILDLAKDHGLVVDLTFTAGTVADCPGDNCLAGTVGGALTYNEYKAGLEDISTELVNAGSAYKHVMFDLVNEVDNAANGPNDVTMDETLVDDLAEAVHAVDPDRIVFASLGYNCNGDPGGTSSGPARSAAIYANYAETDVAVLHECRRTGWGNDSGARVDYMQANTSLPIYLQESPRWRESSDPNQDTTCWFTREQAEKSLYEAKLAGVAAWNFHTRASFSLNGTANGPRIVDNFDGSGEEADFIDNGIAHALTCSGDCPGSQPTSPTSCSLPSPEALSAAPSGLGPHFAWVDQLLKKVIAHPRTRN